LPGQNWSLTADLNRAVRCTKPADRHLSLQGTY
jgi:hypothetical protein